MTPDNLPSYGQAIALASKDIHERCDVEVNLLWDEGKMHSADSMHKVRVWNGLGSLEYLIAHRDLLERGSAYRQFLEELAAAVHQRLGFRPYGTACLISCGKSRHSVRWSLSIPPTSTG